MAMKISALRIGAFLMFAFPLCLWAQPRTTIALSGSGWKLWKDIDSTWKKDELYLPPVSVQQLPVHAPTGGWSVLQSTQALAVSVPGTAETYLQTKPSPEGDIKGVSWWYRPLAIPAYKQGNKLVIHFEACRYRAEVFINQQLAGYDVIGNTPFDVDITRFVQPNTTVQLAVRITDPGGNFDWGDGDVIKWGKQLVAGSHGFGGITGRVWLNITHPTFIEDLYIQNTARPQTINAFVTVQNQTGMLAKGAAILVSVAYKKQPQQPVFTQRIPIAALPLGQSTFNTSITLPNALLWQLDAPHLYTLTATVKNGNQTLDAVDKAFGFRSFEVTGIGKDAELLLNGKRIVLRSAISWGFWPVTGIFPTEELALKQVKLAKDLGLNTLSFHRCIGQPRILEIADSLGLLYYEEPGHYMSGNRDSFARAMITEKLKRMVKRDRSHPSLVIYNMQNEMRDVDSVLFAHQQADMRAAHALDPSRTITRTSGWAIGNDVNDQAKLHARPFDTSLYMNGWFDYHRAPGPHTWYQSLYQHPQQYYSYTTNKKEIVYWGEEGALSAPPRIAAIKADIDKQTYKGWDGVLYLEQYQQFEQFYKNKQLHRSFPSLDALTLAMGDISFEHQGRKIELSRINNLPDGYVINGWEAEILENHSGIVDCYRNPKGRPSILKYYNQPQYIAVKPRKQVVELPGKLLTDFYIINENNWQGTATLQIQIIAGNGRTIAQHQKAVQMTGGHVYGELLLAGYETTLLQQHTPGMYCIKAILTNQKGVKIYGQDSVLLVDCNTPTVAGKGAVLEYGSQLTTYFKQAKKVEVPTYQSGLGKLDWIAVSRSPNGGDKLIVPTENFTNLQNQPGLTATYYNGLNFDEQVAQQTDNGVNLIVYQGATPHEKVPGTTNYSIRWQGNLIPPFTGKYQFFMETGYGGEGVLKINGQAFNKDAKTRLISGNIQLEAGKPATFLAELQHARHSGAARVYWIIPDTVKVDADAIVERVKKEGTTLLLLDNAASWMPTISKHCHIDYKGSFAVGSNWLGGVHFVTQHPILKDLPTNKGMDWPYEAVVRNGNERSGLLLNGETLIAGAYHCFPQQLGTAMGEIPCGKGKIIFSTLDICNNLSHPSTTAAVARKLLLNMIAFANQKE